MDLTIIGIKKRSFHSISYPKSFAGQQYDHRLDLSYAVNLHSRIPVVSRSAFADARRDCRGDSDRDQSRDVHSIGTIRNDMPLAVRSDACCSLLCVDRFVCDGTL
jgi:hypothetical protein